MAVSSLTDMEILLDGLPLDDISTSMTINSPAAVIWAMYIAAAEKRGVSRGRLRGTLQNDILKEFIAQKEYIFPPEPKTGWVENTWRCQWLVLLRRCYHNPARSRRGRLDAPFPSARSPSRPSREMVESALKTIDALDEQIEDRALEGPTEAYRTPPGGTRALMAQ